MKDIPLEIRQYVQGEIIDEHPARALRRLFRAVRRHIRGKPYLFVAYRKEAKMYSDGRKSTAILAYCGFVPRHYRRFIRRHIRSGTFRPFDLTDTAE